MVYQRLMSLLAIKWLANENIKKKGGDFMKIKKIVATSLIGLIGLAQWIIPSVFAVVTGNINSSYITVTNNAGTADVIQVDGLKSGDVLRVYNSSGVYLTASTGVAAIANGSTFTSTANVTLPTITSGSDYVRVTVQNTGSDESTGTMKTFYPEKKTDVLLNNKSITITNNVGYSALDTVKATGLTAGDLIKVYLQDSPNITYVVNAGFEKTTTTYAPDAFVGAVGLQQTGAALVKYGESSFQITNPSTAITHTLSGLSATKYYAAIIDINNNNIAVTGGVFKVTTPAGAALANASASTTLNTTALAGFTPYVIKFAGSSAVSNQLTLNLVTTSTNPIVIDGLRVVEIPVGIFNGTYDNTFRHTTISLANMYPFMGYLGKAIADLSGIATVSTTLGQNLNNVSITNTRGVATESSKLSKSFASEVNSPRPTTSQVTMINNIGSSDFIKVSKYASCSLVTVKFYDATFTQKASTCAVDATGTKLSFPIDLSVFTGSVMYVSFTETGENEGVLQKMNVPSEKPTPAIATSLITVKNNTGISDSVTVSRLLVNDIIKIYKTKFDSSPTICPAATSANFTCTVNLGTDSKGSIYITRTTGSQSESTKVMKTFGIAN